MDNPDFEYVACLHSPQYRGQDPHKFIESVLGAKSIAAFKGNADVYNFLNSGELSYQTMMESLRGKEKLLYNRYEIRLGSNLGGFFACAMSRELILKSMVEKLRDFYDFIIIECMPSLGMMTINALACADSVLIPVQAAYLPVKGLQQLIKTIGRVKKQLNPKLKIEGILLTMVDNRTNYARDISLMVYDTYSASIKVFGTEIPMSVRASEVSVEGGSIYSYDPKGKAAFAYMALTKEVLKEA